MAGNQCSSLGWAKDLIPASTISPTALRCFSFFFFFPRENGEEIAAYEVWAAVWQGKVRKENTISKGPVKNKLQHPFIQISLFNHVQCFLCTRQGYDSCCLRIAAAWVGLQIIHTPSPARLLLMNPARPFQINLATAFSSLTFSVSM